MPGFELVLDEIRPFARINLFIDVRISGTYTDLETYSIDYVEVPGVALNRPRIGISGRILANDGWLIIDRLHPLWRGSDLTDGIGHVLGRPETIERIETVIQEALAEEAVQRSRRVSIGTCLDRFPMESADA